MKWWNVERGFGFIQRREDEADIFVHYSAIQTNERYKNLIENQPVTFEVIASPKGLLAVRVMPE